MTNKTKQKKPSYLEPEKIADDTDVDALRLIARSYYLHCIEQALVNIDQARMLVEGDITDENHELPLIQRKLREILFVA